MNNISFKICGLLLILFINGCTLIEIANIIFDDDYLHSGVVEKVDYDKPFYHSTKVIFKDGTEYNCEWVNWIEKGDKIEVRKQENSGNFSFTNPDNCKFK